MSTRGHDRLTGAHVATGPADASRRCPYGAETITACRFYEAVSAHGSHPGAETCRYLVREGESPISAARCLREQRQVR